MSRSTFHSVIVIAILLLALTAVYVPDLLSSDQRKGENLPGEFVYVSDLDFWQRTPRESTVTTNIRFDLDSDLNNVPKRVGSWEGIDVPETNEEVQIMLKPEQYVRRLYSDGHGHDLWLSMIGGRSSQPFHAPDICYDADGWQYDLGSHAVDLDGRGKIYGLWLEAEKMLPGVDEPVNQIVYYFYLFPSSQRAISDGIVLFKLTSDRYGTPEDTLAIQSDFVRQLFISAE